jgi:ankyrin repeat-rich membrane spanning protein
MLKAEEGNFEEVQKILADLQQPNINALNRNGSTALSLAAKNGSYGIVEALVQAGADVNIKNSVIINIDDS